MRCGAQILPEREVETITPSPGGGYVVATRHPWRSDLDGESFSAPRVVVAAGVLGTLELLLRNRDEHRTLPQLSQQLGHEVRTNSEALTAIMQPAGQDLSVGPTISSDFHPDDDTHTTINRYMGGSHMRLQLGPLVDDERPARRGARTIGAILRRPWQQLRLMTGRGFLGRLTVLTTMQHAESRIGVQLRRSRLRPWRTALNTVAPDGVRPPSYLAVANEVTRRYAEQSGGRPLNLLGESVGGLSVTAHVLGGAVMGRDASEGVVDVDHETFGHPGLYVMDASVIPANLGVNPSLTITAFAERFAARFPAPLPDTGPAEPVERPLPAAVSLLGLKRAWSELDPVRPDDLPGADLEASFLTPLRRVAPAGLGLIGLPRWFGKRFAVTDGSVSGVNLLRTPDGLRETMPMQVAVRPSLIDGAPTTVVAYAPGTRRPWPWVRDEMRSLPDGRVVGMTVVDLPVLRRLGGTPFLLTPRPDPQD